ncbi:MAG: hypothetical protein AAB364_03285 [Patescibacteria group bacterium]
MIVFECDVSVVESFARILDSCHAQNMPECVVKFGPTPARPGKTKSGEKVIPFVLITDDKNNSITFGPARGEFDGDSYELDVRTFVPTIELPGEPGEIAKAFLAAVALATEGDSIRIEKDDRVLKFWVFPVPTKKVTIDSGLATRVTRE